MTINVLIINRQLVFAVTIKQALEQTGLFDVHAFTTADSALDYLRENQHDVALVDFDLSGRDLLRGLRMIQPDIGLIISPVQPDADQLQRTFNFQGMVDMPFTAREIIPYIDHAAANRPQLFTDETQSLADTDNQPSTQTRSLPDDDNPKRLPKTQRSTKAPRRAFNEPENPDASRRKTDPLKALDDFFANSASMDAQFDEEESQPPVDLPEFSSWDSVMEDEAPSEIFEPPVNDQDTPSVPEVDSNAVRQYLATNPENNVEFGDLLSDIDSASVQESRPSTDKNKDLNSFASLVNSMKVEGTHTPLPDRHQQFIEFILTGGMDMLLGEIEKAKTGPLEEGEEAEEDSQPSSVFEKLAAEEPPMPTLEESGTVADLMLGVSDTGFRNVLALMRGEDVRLDDESAEPNRIPMDIEEAFSSFFESQVNSEQDAPRRSSLKKLSPPASPPSPVFGDFRDEFSVGSPQQGSKESSIPAQLILETALDETSPVESFSLSELINSIDQQLAEHTPEVQPLPSWDVRFKPPRKQRPQDRFIKEPDFLPEEFPTSKQVPTIDESQLPESVDEPTVRGEAIYEAADEAPIEQPARPVELPQDWGDWAVANDDEGYSSELDPYIEEIDEEEFGQAYTPPVLDEFLMAVDESPDDQTTLLEYDWDDQPLATEEDTAAFDYQIESLEILDDDPQIAQIALSLTQVSLELTAEATLLTRLGDIVAVEGQLTPQDIAELREVIAQGAINEDEARIGFITLNTNGKSYMLYSRRTIGDFILSMVFAADTPLRDIRRQGKRLMEALESVPEVPTADMASSQQLTAVREDSRVLERSAEATVLAPYAYVWLLRDPNKVFAATTAQAIGAGLRTQLGEQGWQIRAVQVQDEYVYLLADVPGNRSASEIIRELKRRSGEIARVQDANLNTETLWADSYLVLTPGREMEPDEINQFINFERMF